MHLALAAFPVAEIAALWATQQLGQCPAAFSISRAQLGALYPGTPAGFTSGDEHLHEKPAKLREKGVEYLISLSVEISTRTYIVVIYSIPPLFYP